MLVAARAMKDTIEAIKEAGLQDKLKVMIGGEPTRQEFADEIRADFYGPGSTAGRNFARETMTASSITPATWGGCS